MITKKGLLLDLDSAQIAEIIDFLCTNCCYTMHEEESEEPYSV